ncbi:MAG: TIGR00730 family Rossman fold protein [Odoribacter sp.]
MNIAIFCASADSIDALYREDARKIGQEIARHSWHLIYGGTSLGLMKEVAESTIENGGDVTGIIPECIRERGVAAENIGRLMIASDMKERKYMLRQYSDAFIALPGGWGTLEEISEVITLKQLGYHNKPIVFLNTDGFYDGFFDFIHTIREQGFVSPAYDCLYKVVDQVEEAIEYIQTYKPANFKAKY